MEDHMSDQSVPRPLAVASIPYTAAGIAQIERALNDAVDAAEADGLLVKHDGFVMVASTDEDRAARRVHFIIDERTPAYTVLAGHEAEVRSRLEGAIKEALGRGG